MGFRINTNIAAMNSLRNSTLNNIELDKSLTSLSSGLRINKAADDAAGLAIANKMSAQEQGLGQAVRNANDAIGLIQTADGALDEQTVIAKRIRVLAIQAANDTQDATSRAYIQLEVDELEIEYDQITNSTTFNDKVLLDGTNGAYSFQIGHKGTDVKTVTIATIAPSAATGVTTSADARTTIGDMDTIIDTLNNARANLGAVQNSLYSVVRNISTTQVNIAAAESQLRDVDFAAESATFAKYNILAQSGTYAMSQANAVQQNVLRLLQ